MQAIDMKCWSEKIAIVTQDDSNIYMELTTQDKEYFSPVLFEDSKFVKSALNSIDNIGLVADILSGSYGNDYFTKYFFSKYARKVSVIERLAFIGKDGVGAIEFKPSKYKEDKTDSFTMSLKEFKERSIAVYNGEDDAVSYYIAKSNSGAGGAKAKGLALYNILTKQVILNPTSTPQSDCIDSIIKFNTKSKEQSKSYNDELRLEYVYYLLAKECGLEMSTSYLEEDEEGDCYFITKRFDKNARGEKLHMHSLAGILSHDASSLTLGYEMLFKVGYRLVVPTSNYELMFRNMIFNIVFSNRDDHSRNFSFLMNTDKEWCFSPSYDITYSGNNSELLHNQLTINKKFANKINRLGIKKIAEVAGIKNPIEIIQEIIVIKHSRLKDLSIEHGVSAKIVDAIFADTQEIDKKFIKELV